MADTLDKQIVGIAELKLSNSEQDLLITYSLGSCIGLTLYDPVAKVGGLIHCMLPLSKINPEEAKINPAKFTDVGIPMMIQKLFNMGAARERLIAKAAGAAAPIDVNGMFNIGDRNYAVMRKVLWKNNILIAAEDVKGTKPRTMSLYMDTGITTIRAEGKELEL